MTHTTGIDVSAAEHNPVVKKTRRRITATILATQQPSFFSDAISLKQQRSNVVRFSIQLQF